MRIRVNTAKESDMPRKLSDKGFNKIVEDAWATYEGNCETFSAAVGALTFGRLVGWQGVRCVHSHPRYQKFQRILDVRFADVLPEQTEDSERIRGIRIAKKFGDFWRAASAGIVKVTEHRDAEPA